MQPLLHQSVQRWALPGPGTAAGISSQLSWLQEMLPLAEWITNAKNSSQVLYSIRYHLFQTSWGVLYLTGLTWNQVTTNYKYITQPPYSPSWWIPSGSKRSMKCSQGDRGWQEVGGEAVFVLTLSLLGGCWTGFHSKFLSLYRCCCNGFRKPNISTECKFLFIEAFLVLILLLPFRNT